MKKTLFLISACAAAVAAKAQNSTPITPAKPIRLSEVVVTGQNTSDSRSLLPYSVSRIDAQEISQSGAQQLMSGLSARVPSLFVSERNILGFGVSTGGSGNITIRGVGGQPTNAVLVMVDGQPQYSGIFSHPVADSYHASFAERVEVLRGPASVLYGSNAMGGVVNIITREAEATDQTTTELSLQYGSFATLRVAANSLIRRSRFSSLLSFSYDRTNGVSAGFDFRQPTFYAKLGFDFNQHWRLRTDYRFAHSVGNDPVFPRLEDPESQDVFHQDITRGEASATLTNRYRRLSGSLRIYFSHGLHLVDDPRHFESRDHRLGLVAYQNLRLWHGGYATVGIDLDAYEGRIPISGGVAHTPSSLATISSKRIDEYSPYATLSHHFAQGRLVINGGLRWANSSLFRSEIIPQIGAVWRPIEAWNLRGSVAKGYRNPSFKELYLYRMGNAALQPEKMVNYEVVSSQHFGSFDFDVTFFFAKGEDMIQVVDQKNVNVGSFRNKGIEVSAAWQPTHWAQLNAAYSYLSTSVDDLTAAPRQILSVQAALQPAKNLSLDANFRWIEGLFVAHNQPRQTYALLNLCSQYQLTRFLTLTLDLCNLTNTRYQINRGYQMPGLNLHAGAKVSF